MRRALFGWILFPLFLISVLVIGLSGGPMQLGAATDLARPEGEVVLTITGEVSRKNAPHGAEFDMAMLEALGTRTLRTSTPWTEGTAEFRGVLVRDVLELVGAEGGMVRALAINDYSFDIALSDFHDYPVILATEVDGRALTARDKGPLWIVYPLDEFAGRDKEAIELRMVWQLIELKVQ